MSDPGRTDFDDGSTAWAQRQLDLNEGLIVSFLERAAQNEAAGETRRAEFFMDKAVAAEARNPARLSLRDTRARLGR